MSQALEDALAAAANQAVNVGSRISQAKELDTASKLTMAAVAQELTKIRGELTAIRILLTESGGSVAGLGSDHGNP